MLSQFQAEQSVSQSHPAQGNLGGPPVQGNRVGGHHGVVQTDLDVFSLISWRLGLAGAPTGPNVNKSQCGTSLTPRSSGKATKKQTSQNGLILISGPHPHRPREAQLSPPAVESMLSSLAHSAMLDYPAPAPSDRNSDTDQPVLDPRIRTMSGYHGCSLVGRRQKVLTVFFLSRACRLLLEIIFLSVGRGAKSTY